MPHKMMYTLVVNIRKFVGFYDLIIWHGIRKI